MARLESTMKPSVQRVDPPRRPPAGARRGTPGERRGGRNGTTGSLTLETSAAPPAPALVPVKEADESLLADTVLRQLTEHIVMGDFGANGTLPSQGELAASFGVSRTVIREAMRGLCAQGLVEVSQGRAPRVKPPDSTATIASLRLLLRRNRATLLHLMEVRKPLESEIAELAAKRANDEHLRQLTRAVHDLASATALERRIEADVRFHRVLSEATGNPVFVLLLETLAEFLYESRLKTLVHSGVERALAGHRAILRAVEAHDGDAARAAMQEHLRLAARDLQEVEARARSRGS